MSSPAEQPDLVLIQRLAGGTDEWIPVEIPQRFPAAPGADYTMIDRGTDYEAPRSLVAERQGEHLVIQVNDVEVLVLDGFFATEGVAFYPTTDIAAGAGAFSGSPITPGTPALAGYPEGEQVVWSAEQDESDEQGDGAEQGGTSPLLWGGLAVAGLGLAAAAGGGGGGGSSSSSGGTTPPPADTTAPLITSDTTAPAIDENSGAGQVVYTATATDEAAVTWTLAAEGDAAAFSINPNTGTVTLDVNPDYETQSNYTFTIVATDPAGNSSRQTVALPVSDLDDSAPVITSSDTAAAIDEISGAGQVVYTATATDAGTVTWSLGAGGDAAAFDMDASSGAVTLIDNPDFETKSSYSFTVVATDDAGNASQLTVALAVNDLDDSRPFIDSGATAAAIDENSGSGQVVYTATAVDDGTFTWSLGAGGDAAAFDIDANSGAVTLIEDPDFETKPSYSFTVVATDDAGNVSQQAVSLAINDLDENPPVITSGVTATAINENSGAGQVVYRAAATDEGTVTWSLGAGGDAAAFSVNASSGAVTLIANPDFETKPSYSFTVVATDPAGNSSQRAVSLAIKDLDENPPVITSGATATAINENSGPGQVVYRASATDEGTVTWRIAPGGDAAAFNINPTTGAVTLIANPDFETKPSYSFTVVATDPAGNSSQRAVSLAIKDLDENPPVITSGATATAIDENSGAGQVVYRASATDEGTVTWSFAPGGDAAFFNIDASSGAVTLIANPDYEARSSYSFTVVATDPAGNSSPRAVSLAINDLDETAPVITSGATATAIDENSGAGQVIYRASATDASAVTWTLAGSDAAAFNITASTGAVTLIANPDYESKPSYSFTVVATDDAGNSSQRAVSLAINDLDDFAPNITSGATATAIDENSGAGQVVYTATATDDGTFTWGLAGTDAAAFNINASTGAVTLTANPDYELKPSYSFTVVATDNAGNSSQQVVSLAINDLDDTAPVITSGATATAIDENSGAGQVVYDANATDAGTITWSLAGVDAAAFDIDASSGAVTLTANPDYELKPSYSFTVVATDNVGNSSQQVVSLAINDLDDTAPTLTSSAPADDATDVPVGDDLVLTFSENVQAGSGDIVIRDAGDIRTIDVTDGTQVSISGNQVTINPTDDLGPDGTYNVQIDAGALTDAAGNPYAGILNSSTLNFTTESAIAPLSVATEIAADTSIVVFDLVQGSSSDHSGRTFESDVSYDIYILVDSNDAALSTAGDGPGTWGTWSGAANLGSDDRVTLVGDGAAIQAPAGPVTQVAAGSSAVAWQSSAADGGLLQGRTFTRATAGGTDSVVLFDTAFGGATFSGSFSISMPAGILTSQGLA